MLAESKGLFLQSERPTRRKHEKIHLNHGPSTQPETRVSVWAEEEEETTSTGRKRFPCSNNVWAKEEKENKSTEHPTTTHELGPYCMKGKQT